MLIFWAIVGIVWVGWKADRAGYFDELVIIQKKPKPDRERYEVLMKELARWRGELAVKYKTAKTAEQKLAVEYDARVMLELVMPEMMRCWVGTGYDFNGTAERPGEGKVACGYFVSTVLRDAGFRVNRYKLAQQPSENILRTFLPRKSCLLKVDKDYDDYADWVEGLENGIYMIGLDTHVGFLVNREDGVYFFHSSASRLRGVVEERRSDAGAIRRSKWRMIGNLSGEPSAIRTWLQGDSIVVRS
ncbi:hypothetical protein [Luteolibacter sp. AS25]|uniref:hypothetical protein n=1 Tax=Luteolibacter sp. AS25 TaxID=3135776 RepID=UPI00398B0A18